MQNSPTYSFRIFPSRIVFLLGLWALCVQLVPASAPGQHLLNLDFEERSPLDASQPFAWTSVHLPDGDYSMALDEDDAASGDLSLRIRSEPEDPSGFRGVTQSLPLEPVRGKAVRFTGKIRTKDLSEGHARLWMRVDGMVNGEREVLAFDNMRDRADTGTSPWTAHAIELIVDEAATHVAFGVLQSGRGTAWFDDLALEVEGVPYDQVAEKPWVRSSDEVEWIREHAVSIRTDEPGTDLSDLQAMAPALAGARIIALGEATHGTREFFRMKHRIVEYLANEYGTVIFAIEANMPECRAINHYVLTGEGDPREALRGIYFWTWQTEEVLEMIEWMREFNASGAGRVEFWGFDMQTHRVAVQAVRAFVETADPDFLPSLEHAYSGITDHQQDRARSAEQHAQAQEQWAAARRVLAHLEANQDRYLDENDAEVVNLAIQDARIVEQALGFFLPDGQRRDASMADNVVWIAERQDPDTKVVLWAHNGHISRSPRAMGSYLSERYRDQYRIVGFTFGEGDYTARGPRGLTDYPAPGPLEGSVENALRLSGIPRLALDLRKSREDANGAWLLDVRPFRAIGAFAMDFPYSPTPVAKLYDVLIYLDHTAASRLLE